MARIEFRHRMYDVNASYFTPKFFGDGYFSTHYNCFGWNFRHNISRMYGIG